jgi:hypothetical protein
VARGDKWCVEQLRLWCHRHITCSWDTCNRGGQPFFSYKSPAVTAQLSGVDVQYSTANMG